MKLNEIEGAQYGRLRNPDSVGRAAVRRETNIAYGELLQAIRDADSDIADVVRPIDVQANLNTYPLPAGVDTMRRVERFDLTTNQNATTPVAIPCRQIPFTLLARDPGPGYSLGPTGIILVPMPWQDFAGGLRLTFLPQAEPLEDDDQEPQVPAKLHDVISSKSMARVLSLAGAAAANPEEVNAWIIRNERLMITYLNPSGRESVTRIFRANNIYRPKGLP